MNNKLFVLIVIALIGFTAHGQEQKPGQGGGQQQPPQGGQQGAQLTNATAPTGGGGNATGGGGAGGGMGDPNKSLLECIKGIDKLSMLSMALARPELKEVSDKLDKKEGEYTLFAPVNDAVQDMLQTANTSAANQTFSEQDKESLLVAGVHYHIVPKKLTTKTMKQLELPKTLLNDSKWVNLPNNQSQRLHIMDETGTKKFQIWFGLDKNGREKRANFVVQDIECSNGVIHIIDKVVEIPLLSSKILTAGGLDKFVEAVKKNGLEDKLDKTAGVTIFAPTNNAFDLPQGQNEDELKKLVTNMIQDGIFLIKADSKGPIKFKKAGEEEKEEGGKNETTGGATGEKGAANATAAGEKGGANATAGGAGGANATTGGEKGGATGIRKLLQAIANATGGATGEKGGANATTGGEKGGANATAGGEKGGAANATAGGAGANATAGGKQEWKLSGSFNNWKVDGISIIVHDVFTQNGVIHVVDKFIGLPKPAGAMNASFSCEDMKCPAGDECCDVSIDSIKEITPRCYNPSTHVCASRGSFLCGKDAPLVCGSSCFSQDKYVCHKGLFLCPVSAPKLCSISCYDPKQFKCIEGNLKLLGSEEQDKEGGGAAGGKKEEGATGAKKEEGATGGAKPGEKKEEKKK